MNRAAATAVVLSFVGVVVAAGCGSIAAGDEASGGGDGRQLFIERCGSCHALAEAGTRGVIGPSLDDALDDLRDQGFRESTIRELVRGQIAYPVTDPPTDAPGMPPEAELFAGLDDTDAAADAVSIYVAANAGKPVERQAGDGGDDGEAADDPQTVFAQNCGGCHVLSKAKTTGTVGPNLDESSASVDEAREQIANGGGGMPPFKGQLSDEMIQALAEYVAQR